jgi:hypothetical protein
MKSEPDSLIEYVSLDEGDLAALRRVLELVVPQRPTIMDDVGAIKRVNKIIETGEVARENTMAAIQRAIDAQGTEA